jgi:hypothetical protein
MVEDKMSKIKQLYIGYFQTRLKLFVERVMAYSERQAWSLVCKRIAKKQGVSERIVYDWFSDKDKYTIKLEVEFKEVEE